MRRTKVLKSQFENGGSSLGGQERLRLPESGVDCANSLATSRA